MAYVRKTRDEFVVEQYTGRQHGWEVVCTEDEKKQARLRKIEYVLNQPAFRIRVRKVRVKLEQH